MKNEFLALPSKEQEKILRAQSTKLGVSDTILEKDIWLCWTLHKLFSMPNRPEMAFKGGTSLSKVYNLIYRFSEDLDITIDVGDISKDLPSITQGMSKSALKKLSLELKQKMSDLVNSSIVPYLKNCLDKEFPDQNTKIIVDKNGEEVRLYYPSVIKNTLGSYIQDNILLEFGGRNSTMPSETKVITAEIAENISALRFPQAELQALSPQRTFWEKVTLIHVECNRATLKSDTNRLSRHWYDLAMLYESPYGKQAIKNQELLKDVIQYKSVFFNSSYANYEDCLNKKIKLIPESRVIEQLKLDYREMIKANMFYDTPPPFKTILQTMEEILIAIDKAGQKKKMYRKVELRIVE